MADAWDGRPLNPEQDGWHWLHHPEDLRPMVQPWNAELGGWVSGALHSPQGVVDLGFRYLGPCLTPAEVQAREAAAAEAMREACAAIVRTHAAAARKCSEEADVIHRIRAEYLTKAFALNAAADDILATLPLPGDET